jgi:hypothetical protein
VTINQEQVATDLRGFGRIKYQLFLNPLGSV